MGVLSDNRSQIVNGGLISASFVSDLYDVLTGNTLESVSISGSVNITGSLIGNLTGTADTASYVVTAQTASYVTTAQTASYVLNAVSSSFATSASFATTASYSLVNVISSSSLADSSSFATSASFATTAATASYLENDYIYTEVTASSAEILAMGSSGIELLAAPGANKYYDIPKIHLEYTHNTTAYTLADPVLYFYGAFMGNIDKEILTTASSKVILLDGNSSVKINAVEDIPYHIVPDNGGINQPVQIYTWAGTNPTLGDGTILAKIWYKVKTFGTEL